MQLTPSRAKFLMNLWGPFRGAAIRIESIREDWREVTVSMRSRFYNRNIMGTHFGGSLYAMADPPYLLMLMNLLGPDYLVWDKAARVEYLKPGRGTVTARFAIEDARVEEVRVQTASGDAYLPEFEVDVTDAESEVVARIHKTLYVRRRLLPHRPMLGRPH